MKYLIAFFLFSAFAFNFLPSDGSVAPEIELVNPEGKTVKLSDLKGKIVLIDFWASWCRPCRAENPNVVEAYAKYAKKKFKNAKGFEVFSVSLDRQEDPWKNAIKDDKLTWSYHGWDKEGKAARAYGAATIPFGVLVDQDGKIIAQGQAVRGLNLHIELDKLVK